ncbi:MAG: accessory gene regulator B family protein [Oscillospiraceae bacterium]|nr:accessory gene regulator B family protein [Oscillospiraceae bacterium]
MIQFLADRTAQYLAKDDDPADIEVIAYGYYMFYQQWLITIAILLVSLPFGWFFPVLAAVTTTMVLRGCVAGTHATHPLTCKIAAFSMSFIPVILAEVFGLTVVPIAILVMYLLCVALIVKYAPGDTDVKKIKDPLIRKSMKIRSMVWVSAFFAAVIISNGVFPEISFVIAVSALVTCFMVHPLAYRLFGFDPVTKEAFRLRC